MSFLAPQTNTPAAAVSSPRVNTYREAEAVPFPLGYFRLAPKWVSDRFNDHWTNGGQTGQAFCSVVGVLCHGPIDQIRGFYKDGDIAKLIDITRPDNPADPNYWYFEFMTHENSESGALNICRIYWGREDQPVDSWLTSTSGQDHPPRRGICYVIFRRLHCGTVQANSQARPALPNVEFTGIRLPSPTLPAGLRAPAVLGAPRYRGVNLLSALADIATHPRGGMGLNWDLVDQDDLTSKIANMESGAKPVGGLSGEMLWVSPILTSGTEAEAVFTRAMEDYLDGWFYSYGGKLRVDWFPNDGTVPENITELSIHDLVRETDPKLKFGTLAEAPTSIAVSCLEGDSADMDLAEVVEVAPVPFVRELTGEAITKTLDRQWYTARDSAAAYAARYAASTTIPELTGEVTVRLDRAVNPDGTILRPGNVFKLNWSPGQIEEVLRVVERAETGASVKLKVKRERGVASLPWTPPHDARTPIAPIVPPALADDEWKVMESPADLGRGVLVLARRPSMSLPGLNVHLDEDNNWAAGPTVLGSQGFCSRATVQAACSAGATTLDITGTDEDLLTALGSGFSAAEAADNTLLIHLDSEWLSVGAVTVLSPGVFRLGVLRGRLGSTAAAHSVGAFAFVASRLRIKIWPHAVFAPGETRYFKVTTFNAFADSSMSSAKSVVFSSLYQAENAKVVRLLADAQQFLVNKAGQTSPAAITFTAVGQNLLGAPTFEITSGEATLTGTGNVRSLAYGAMVSDLVTVRVTWDSQVDYVSIVRLREGADGLPAGSNFLPDSQFEAGLTGNPWFVWNNANLTQQSGVNLDTAHTIPGKRVAYVGISGSPSPGINGGWYVSDLWNGYANPLPVAPGKTYQVQAKLGLEGAAYISVGLAFRDSNNNSVGETWGNQVHLTEGFHGGSSLSDFKLSSAVAVAPPTATRAWLMVRSVVADGTANPRFFVLDPMLAEATPGQTQPSPWNATAMNGQDAIIAILSNEAHTLAADKDGNVQTFDGASSLLKVYRGIVDESSYWAVAAFPSTGITGNLIDGAFYVTGMTVDSGYVDMQASRAGYSSLTKRFTLTKSRAGQTGQQGPVGNDGTPGPKGDDGRTSYFHVAYATNADGTAGFNHTSGPYIGTYVDFTQADSNVPSAYTWKQFRGTDGIAGTNGANGQTSYLHIKYSDDGGTSFTANSGEAVGKYIGTYVDFNQTDSNVPSAYTWAPMNVPNPNAPAAPGQITLTNNVASLAPDGTASSTLTFTVPAMPTGAAYQQLVIRDSSGNFRIVGFLTNTSQVTGYDVRMLVPGLSYNLGLIAFNEDGKPSSFVAGWLAPYTAVGDTTPPAAPTNVHATKDGVVPRFLPGTRAFMVGSRFTWTRPTDPDFSHMEVKRTTWDDVNEYAQPENIGPVNEWIAYGVILTGFYWFRSVDFSGNASAWVRSIESVSTTQTVGTGTISSEDKNDARITGIMTGSGASVRKVLVRQTINTVFYTGTGTQHDQGIDISGCGFSTVPDSFVPQIVSDDTHDVRCNYDNGNNSSSQIWVKVTRKDGGSLTGAPVRVQGEAIEYD